MTAKPQLPDRAPRAKGEPTALDGLLVVDFTRVVAGPACTQTLADFGAEVIKIENPDGGDDTRHYEHAEIGGESAAFLSLNRNKRGIALDFTNPAALEVARELIAKADVVVENFSGGVMKKYRSRLCLRRGEPIRGWSIARSPPMAARVSSPCVRGLIRSRRPKAASCR